MKDMSNNTEKIEFKDKKLEIICRRELVVIGADATITDTVCVQNDVF